MKKAISEPLAVEASTTKNARVRSQAGDVALGLLDAARRSWKESLMTPLVTRAWWMLSKKDDGYDARGSCIRARVRWVAVGTRTRLLVSDASGKTASPEYGSLTTRRSHSIRDSL